MKEKNSVNPLFVLATILLALFISVTKGLAQSAPYFDAVGNIQLSGQGDVTSSTLSTWNPYTLTLEVPTIDAATSTGISLGWWILPTVGEVARVMDNVRFTRAQFSLYHYDAVTGVRTPVKLPNGSNATGINVSSFGTESGTARPSVFTTSTEPGPTNPAVVNSPTNSLIVGTTVANVGAIFATKQSLPWNFIPDLTKPTLNQGYVVVWDIRFVPTYLGVTYPEVTMSQNQSEFTIKVTATPMPEFVEGSLKPGKGPNNGTPIQFKGQQIEFYALERSTDLVHWTKVPYGGVGSEYLGNGVYEWVTYVTPPLLIETRYFYRMRYTGQRGFWRMF